jgi:two-component system invasion response regulator UvrY
VSREKVRLFLFPKFRWLEDEDSRQDDPKNTTLKNVLLADDHSIVRSGIKALLKEHFQFQRIDEAEEGTELFRLMKIIRYDLVILDITMPELDLAHALQWIQTSSSPARVLIFTMHQEDIYGPRCLGLGASGFIHKTAPNEEIIQAVRDILGGKKYISAHLASIMSESTHKKERTNPFLSLSARELELANLLNSGKSLPEICTILNIQYSTANTHKRRLFEKLNVQNIFALCRLMQVYNMQS